MGKKKKEKVGRKVFIPQGGKGKGGGEKSGAPLHRKGHKKAARQCQTLLGRGRKNQVVNVETSRRGFPAAGGKKKREIRLKIPFYNCEGGGEEKRPLCGGCYPGKGKKVRVQFKKGKTHDHSFQS